jgi:hypothetical protein
MRISEHWRGSARDAALRLEVAEVPSGHTAKDETESASPASASDIWKSRGCLLSARGECTCDSFGLYSSSGVTHPPHFLLVNCNMDALAER